jgi:hypothetical protein
MWGSCGARPDKDNLIAMKSRFIDCPVCLEIQARERARAKARLEKLLASPYKGPQRLPIVRPVETMRVWYPSAKRSLG